MDAYSYQQWVQQALRTVVRKALETIAEHGLPSGHQVGITFAYAYPGVIFPKSFKYQDTISILFDNTFWNLVIDQESFSVALLLEGRMQTITVPFGAIKAFIDMKAEFGLELEVYTPEVLPEAVEAVEAVQDFPSARDNVIAFEAFRKKAPEKEEA